jgi:hypothetical protein
MLNGMLLSRVYVILFGWILTVVIKRTSHTASALGEQMSVGHWWNHIDRRKPKGRKTCAYANLSSSNPTWAGLGFKPGLPCEKPVAGPPELWHGFLICAL